MMKRSPGSWFGFLLAAALFSAIPVISSAEVLLIEEYGPVLEPPVGWGVMDVSENRYTFNDFTGDAFLQIKFYPGDQYDSVEELYRSVIEKTGALGDAEVFDYYGRSAVFGNLAFESAGFRYSGYGFFTDGEDFDMAVLSFASEDRVGLLNDYILSALDSIALSPGLYLRPGPVSRYYLESYGSPERVETETVFKGGKIGWMLDAHSAETSQLMIEREAAILADYKPGTEAGTEAWKRYYRMIYRDCYSRLDYPAGLLFRKTDGEKAAEDLLDWVQGFDYRRTAGSDLISPLSAAAFEEGDCDSRSLLYIILLNHYGIDSALMVSSVYSHAMAAVDMEGSGARINIDGRAFLVAETTDDVAIGLIASDMADPANWITVPLMEKEPWN